MSGFDKLHQRGAVLLTTAALLAGCGYEGASSLPLPGAIGGKGTYPVTVVFDDATNLVVKETCRSNDTVIGSVESVTLDADLKARVVCRIKDSVRLPANAVATLSETSLLGERFVALGPPEGQEPKGELARGAVLPVSAARADPNVEMVFGALSQVLNGGSLGSIETITRELNAALSGSDVGATLESVDRTVATFNDHRSEIAASLVSLDKLAGRLAKQRTVLAAALDSVPGGLAVLDRQTTRLVATLSELADLSRTAVPLIARTRANTKADLEHLAPVLSQLTKASGEIALTLNRIATFPFPSNALSTIRGDFGGMYATFELDVDFLNRLLGVAPQASTPNAPRPGRPAPQPADPLDDLPVPGDLLGTQGGLADLLNGLLGGGR
jgi:phospholipid/cholesterol/gamma-HCH transport system substrate-binding protein